MVFSYKNLTLLVLMLVGAVFAITLTPSSMIADKNKDFILEAAIPHDFGEWNDERKSGLWVINPQQQETLDTIYSQTLSRTYINSHNERVMLSIAYGRDQRDANQAHKPEICYPAQGFTVTNRTKAQINTKNGVIPVTRIETYLSQRHEPVTYWITVGTHVVISGLDKKLNELRYGLNGEIPDGVLFRVSTIDINSQHAYEVQANFVRDLLGAIEPGLHLRISGLNLKP